jgi:altronate hydrolase
MAILKINPADNVAVALEDVAAGAAVEAAGGTLTAGQDIPRGHKIALRAIKAGEPVVKYGYPIGNATAEIAAGDWVHTHNIRTRLEDKLDYTYEPALTPVAKREASYFQGFRRRDGKAGIRNELWVIPTVGCVNGIAEIIAKRAQALVKGSIEGCYNFGHAYGCSQMGDDHVNTQKALAGLVRHPNAGGVLVLALGCENNTIEQFQGILGDWDPDRVKFLVTQDCEDELEEGLRLMEELAGFAGGFVRESIPMSELVVGLKCGGSDGLSGITANPLVGVFSDMLIGEGGATILTEVPEMFGAETILMNRCRDRATFDKTVALVNNFKDYFTNHGQAVYENPSPGNKKGGITTLEDKSLGCTQKGGSAVVNDVLSYGDAVREKGLNLLQAPGNDLVASTALAVSGAHMVLFTTGRGTPFGSPVPTAKISSNSALAARKHEWIDFDAGRLVTGSAMPEIAAEFYEFVRKLASGGVVTKTEQYGIRDMAIFKDGITL